MRNKTSNEIAMSGNVVILHEPQYKLICDGRYASFPAVLTSLFAIALHDLDTVHVCQSYRNKFVNT